MAYRWSEIQKAKAEGREPRRMKKRKHRNQLDRKTVPEMVDAFWKSGVYPTKTGVLRLVQRAVRNALARHKRKHGV